MIGSPKEKQLDIKVVNEIPRIRDWHKNQPGKLNDQGKKAYDDLLRKYPPGIDRDRYVFGKWVDDKK